MMASFEEGGGGGMGIGGSEVKCIRQVSSER